MKSNDHDRLATDQYQEPASVSHDAGAKDQSREDSSGAIDQTGDKQRDDSTPSSSKSQRIPLSRRDALMSALAVGGLSLFGTGQVAAQGPPPRQWRNDIDANGHRLDNLGALTMATNPTDILDFEGENLTIVDGVLNATDTDTDTHTAVSDDEGVVVDDVADITFATNLSVSDDGDGSVTVDASGGGASPWEDSDDDGLLEAAGFDGIDVETVANTAGPFEIEVNGERALRIEPGELRGEHVRGVNWVAGHPVNEVSPGVEGATIAGGGTHVFDHPNRVTEAFGTIGGGRGNTVSEQNGTIAGGTDNTASGNGAFVSGGNDNIASGGGSAVVGGNANEARGALSFASGRRAIARHRGSYVWADSNNVEFISEDEDTWSARATGGARFVSAIDSDGDPTAGVELAAGGGSWSSLSDRAAKEAVEPVEPGAVLDAVRTLPVSTWAYKSEADGVRHMGPMAQDFHAAFGLGADGRHITGVDADGVALAAIQGLAAELDEKTEQLSELKRTNRNLRDRLSEVADRLEMVEEQVAPIAG